MAFRYPRLPKAVLDRFYRAGNADSWQTQAELRSDWQMVKAWLGSKSDVKRILDVGCFDGRLLEFLGRQYAWLGVEVHDEAATLARARGVDVVCDDFDKLAESKAYADVAIAIDVIEHTYDPRRFLEVMASRVRPGGYVVIATGNTEALTWRLMGSRYWYCHIAEHLSFINPTWARLVAPTLGMEVVDVRAYSHAERDISPRQRLHELLSNLVLRTVPGLYVLLRRIGMGGIDLRRFPALALSPPYWLTARDHMFLALKKSESAPEPSSATFPEKVNHVK